MFLSSDGSLLAVGGPGNNATMGTTWTFISSRGIWSQQADLVGTNSVGYPSQGTSVSLSSDGNTLAVGGPSDGGPGATWIFTK